MIMFLKTALDTSMVLSFLFLLGMPHARGKEVYGITSSSSSLIAATGGFGFK